MITAIEFSLDGSRVLALVQTKQYTIWIVPSRARAGPLCIHHTFSQSAVDSNEDRWSERPLLKSCYECDTVSLIEWFHTCREIVLPTVQRHLTTGKDSR